MGAKSQGELTRENANEGDSTRWIRALPIPERTPLCWILWVCEDAAEIGEKPLLAKKVPKRWRQAFGT